MAMEEGEEEGEGAAQINTPLTPSTAAITREEVWKVRGLKDERILPNMGTCGSVKCRDEQKVLASNFVT